MDIKTGKDLSSIIIEGKISIFSKFYTSFFQRLILAADKYVKDPYVAEEIVQNVFLKIWESPEILDHVVSIKSYLYRAIINASINHISRQRSIGEHHLKIAADFSESMIEDLDDENELIITIREEIDKLPPQCGKVFKLNRFEGKKYKEIATLLGLSEKTVENHIGVALKHLRKSLSNNPVIQKSVRNRIFLNLILY